MPVIVAEDILEQVKAVVREMIKNNETRRTVSIGLSGQEILIISSENQGLILAQEIEVDGNRFFFGYDKKEFE